MEENMLNNFGIEGTIDKLFTTNKTECDSIKHWIRDAEKEINIKHDEQIIRKLFLKIMELDKSDLTTTEQYCRIQLVNAINIIIQKRLISFHNIEHNSLTDNNTIWFLLSNYIDILKNINLIIVEKRSEEYNIYDELKYSSISITRSTDVLILEFLNDLRKNANKII